MNTETTKTKDGERPDGWVFYDGECRLCTGTVARWRDVLERRGFSFAPLQTDWVRARLGLLEGELPEEIKILTRDGRLTGGVGGLAELARSVWWAWPLFALAQVPGVRGVMNVSYRALARRRYCLAGRCSVRPLAPRVRRRRFSVWLARIFLPVAAKQARRSEWAELWVWAFVIGNAVELWQERVRAGKVLLRRAGKALGVTF